MDQQLPFLAKLPTERTLADHAWRFAVLQPQKEAFEAVSLVLFILNRWTIAALYLKFILGA